MLNILAIQLLMRSELFLFGPYSNYKILKWVMITTDKLVIAFINAQFVVIFFQRKLSTINIVPVLALSGIQNC
jgi:hypothetical protein